MHENFISHKNPNHINDLEKQDLDLKYQQEFVNYFKDLFSHPELEGLRNMFPAFVQNSGSELFVSAYIKPSFRMSLAISPDLQRERTFFLSERSREKFTNENKDITNEEIGQVITKMYTSIVNINSLLESLSTQKDQAKKNLLQIIIQIFDPNAISITDDEVEIKHLSPDRPAGQCVMSERHMLAYVSGKHINPGKGYINLITDNDGSPLMVEKVNLGDRSCISLKLIRINGVLIPPGAIFSSQPDKLEPLRNVMRWFSKKEGAINYVTKLAEYKGFEFIRMSIISVPEEIRASACGSYFLSQQNKAKGYINYDWITPEVISDYATNRLDLKR